MKNDIRWHQRLQSYSKALKQLSYIISETKKRTLNDIEKQGLIQAFEFTHELSWNLLKDYFEDQGNQSITGSKDAFREAFKMDIIQDGEAWMETIKSRNKTSHTYNQSTANEIHDKVIDVYHRIFVELEQKMNELKKRC